MSSHPEIGEHVAQRYTGLSPTWTVDGVVEDLTHGVDLRPRVLLLSDEDGVSQWTVEGLSAEGFWEMFVRVSAPTESEGT